jgi:hypothetical protein
VHLARSSSSARGPASKAHSRRRARRLPRAQAATWAWAGNSLSRLGSKRPDALLAVDLRSTVVLAFWSDEKPVTVAPLQTLGHSFPPLLSHHAAQLRVTAAAQPSSVAEGEEEGLRPTPSRRRACSLEAEHAAVEGPHGGALLP